MKTHFGVTNEQNAESLTDFWAIEKSALLQMMCVTSSSIFDNAVAAPVFNKEIIFSLFSFSLVAVIGITKKWTPSNTPMGLIIENSGKSIW